MKDGQHPNRLVSESEDLSPPSLTALEAVAALREETDHHLEGRVAALPQHGAEISCRPGCTACCHHLVVVSPLEAHALAEYLVAHPETARAIATRIPRWREQIAAHPELRMGLERLNAAEGYLPDEEGGALELEYFRAVLPCPFLAPETQLCSVYPVRPFACREHMVVSPPELCTLDMDGVTTAETRMEARTVANLVGAECYGLPDRLLLLPEALEYAAAHPEEPARAAPAAQVRAVMENAQRRVRMVLARLRLAAAQAQREKRGG